MTVCGFIYLYIDDKYTVHTTCTYFVKIDSNYSCFLFIITIICYLLNFNNRI